MGLSVRQAVAAALVVVTLSACDSSTESPAVGVPASMEIVAGEGQSGVVGTELPNPLVVRVRDSGGAVVPGQIVNFRVIAGGGGVFAGVSITNDSGLAQDRWTLGTSTADSQRVEARAVDNVTGEPLVFAVFRATPLPAAPAALSTAGNQTVTGPIGARLSDSLAVKVTDTFGNGVPGETVAWSVSAGGGTISPGTSVTGSDGIGRAEWTLGPRLDTTQVAEATSGSFAPVQFFATPQLPASASVVVAGGDGQTGTVGAALPESLVVRLQLGDSTPVEGSVILWAVTHGGGSIAWVGDTSRTDAQGLARAEWTLGPTAGAQTVAATAGLGNLTPAVFSAAATAGPPDTVFVVSGDGQIGTQGAVLPDSLVAVATDAFGNPVSGVTFDWLVTPGGGTISPMTTVTDAGGRTAVQWTLGSTTGTHWATGNSSILAQPAAFNAFVTRAVASVHVGRQWSCVLTAGGVSYCWGANADGQLGLGHSIGQAQPESVLTALQLTVIQAGSEHACALGVVNDAYCWGSNHFGRLGVTTTQTCEGGLACSKTPIAVSGGLQFLDIAAGSVHSCGVVLNGDAYCWGLGTQGQLGTGTSSEPAPALVLGGITFASVSAGSHTCGLTASGTAYCWGPNGFGELGTGDTIQRTAPAAVSGGLAFSSLSLGFGHSCALTSGGTAYCWGYNDLGRLGNGSMTDAWVPTLVSGGLTFQSLSAGIGHTCGIVTDGSAYCWGSNTWGELGNGQSGPGLFSPVPVPVAGNHHFQSIGAGQEFSCGVTTDGELYCWGTNDRGQLGVGTADPNDSNSVPVRVLGPL